MRKLIAAAIVVAAATAVAPLQAEAAFFQVGAVVGSPGEAVGNVAGAGAVHLFPFDEAGPGLDPAGSVTITRASIGGKPVAGDRFGAAVELALIDDDNSRDLVIGAPGIDRQAGRVYVILFEPMQGRFDVANPITLRQGTGGLRGTSEAGDRFGTALQFVYAGVLDPWLAIGAPGEDIGSATDAGAVTVVGNGTDTADDAVFYQGSGLPGSAESGDAFGSSLGQFGSARVAVGAPGEDVGSATDAGNVTAFNRGQAGSGVEYHQGAGGVPDTSEAGDRFGAALEGRTLNAMSIGVPGEDVGTTKDAGAVIDLDVPVACCAHTTSWHQGADGIVGTAEAGDRFGAALTSIGVGTLVVGAPGEDVGSSANAGIVHLIGVVGGGDVSLTGTGNRQYHQESPAVPGTGETGDGMGGALGRSGGVVLVGMPGEDVHGAADAGAVIAVQFDDDLAVVAGAGTRQITQDDAAGSTAEKGDRFGAGIADPN